MTNVHANVIAKLVFSFDIVLVMSESRYLRKDMRKEKVKVTLATAHRIQQCSA